MCGSKGWEVEIEDEVGKVGRAKSVGDWRSAEGAGSLRLVGAETLDSLKGENGHFGVDIGTTLLELNASCLEPVSRKALTHPTDH